MLIPSLCGVQVKVDRTSSIVTRFIRWRGDFHSGLSAEQAHGIKGIEQQYLAMLHGFRRGKVAERTALVNQLRGHLAERGIVLPRSVNQLRKRLPRILEDGDNDLSTLARRLFAEQYQALKGLDEAIAALDREIPRSVSKMP